MERKEKDKGEEPRGRRRRILGVVAAAGAVAVAAGAFFLLSSVGDSKDDQTVDDTTARARRTMKAPGSGGENIFRDRFEEDPKNYFKTRRVRGPKAAVEEFQ